MLKNLALRTRVLIFSNIFHNIHTKIIKKPQIFNSPTQKQFIKRLHAGILAFFPVAYCSNDMTDSTSASKGQFNESTASANVAHSIHQSDEYFKVGKFEESYEVLKLYEDQNNIEVLWRLARSLYNMSKDKKLSGSQKAELINHGYRLINRALEINDQNGKVHKWMAILLDAKNTLDGTKARIQALPEFKKHLMHAMEFSPNDATTIYILGQYCYNIASMPWYQRKIASALFATPPEATFEEALEYFSKAEEIEPNFYSLNLLMLGKTYLQLNKKDAARYWLKCASTYPIRTEEDKEVRKEAEELLRKNPPQNPEAELPKASAT